MFYALGDAVFYIFLCVVLFFLQIFLINKDFATYFLYYAKLNLELGFFKRVFEGKRMNTSLTPHRLISMPSKVFFGNRF